MVTSDYIRLYLVSRYRRFITEGKENPIRYWTAALNDAIALAKNYPKIQLGNPGISQQDSRPCWHCTISVSPTRHSPIDNNSDSPAWLIDRVKKQLSTSTPQLRHQLPYCTVITPTTTTSSLHSTKAL